MDWLNNFLKGVFASITGGLRKFVAFAMAMFFLGSIYGFFVPLIAEKTGFHATYWLALPLALALLAYLSTQVAFVLFLLLLGLLFFVFL